MYYDDIELGTTVRVGSYRIDADDIVSYAPRWDPLPVHVDEQAARQTMFGGLTASGSHTLAIRTLLLHRVPIQDGVIAAGGAGGGGVHQPGPARRHARVRA